MTGDEVIRFFARHQDAVLCPVKFVHLNRVPCRWYEFRPYDLVVVPEHKARNKAPKRAAFATFAFAALCVFVWCCYR